MTEQSEPLQCAYCEQIATTEDHIPPKNIFPKGKRDDLIRVPACLQCNRSASKDDEYFRYTIVTAAYARSAIARDVWDTIVRGVHRPKSQGFRSHIRKHIVEVPVKTPQGLFAGYTHVALMDATRTDRTLRRIVKGFHHHIEGRRYPDPDELISVIILRDEYWDYWKSVEGLSTVQDGVFRYLVQCKVDEVTGLTLCGGFLCFYDCVNVVVTTGLLH